MTRTVGVFRGVAVCIAQLLSSVSVVLGWDWSVHFTRGLSSTEGVNKTARLVYKLYLMFNTLHTGSDTRAEIFYRKYKINSYYHSVPTSTTQEYGNNMLWKYFIKQNQSMLKSNFYVQTKDILCKFSAWLLINGNDKYYDSVSQFILKYNFS